MYISIIYICRRWFRRNKNLGKMNPFWISSHLPCFQTFEFLDHLGFPYWKIKWQAATQQRQLPFPSLSMAAETIQMVCSKHYFSWCFYRGTSNIVKHLWNIVEGDHQGASTPKYNSSFSEKVAPANIPICSMGLEYSPAFTISLSHSCRQIFLSHGASGCVKKPQWIKTLKTVGENYHPENKKNVYITPKKLTVGSDGKSFPFKIL